MKANDNRPVYELAEWKSRTLPPHIRLTEADRTLVAYSTLDRYAEAVTKHKKRLDLTPA